MKVVSLVGVLALLPVLPGSPALGADAGQPGEVAALEKRLAAALAGLAEAKTALAVARVETEAAEAKAKALAQSDSPIESLRSQVRVLERDLQSATGALKRVAADKAAAETALAAARAQLAGSTGLRQPQRAGNAGAPPSESKSNELGELQARLAAAQTALEGRQAEIASLKAAMTEAESRAPRLGKELELALREASELKSRLAIAVQETAELRARAEAVPELQTRIRQLEAERAGGASREDVARLAATVAEADRKLADATEANARLEKERDALREQTANLSARIRQLESETPAAGPGATDGQVSREEHARVVAARNDFESKLATALRSFTLLSRERDELRARVADLAAKLAAAQEKP